MSRPAPAPAVLAPHAAFPEHLRVQIEDYLEGLRFRTDPAAAGLEQAMRYSLLGGGKRVRPVLCLATVRALGRDPRPALPLAAALELIHTYSLIHDDLPAMDDDDLRRGRPSCHRRFGEDVAILAGDGLATEAFHLVLREQAGEPGRVLAALRELAAAAGVEGMVGGQHIDVRGPGNGDVVELQRLHALKTGRLIRAAVTCPLILAGLDEESIGRFRAFADEVGVLFQIVDDILDVTATQAVLGKPCGSDERHGKRTYVSEHGLAEARRLCFEAHARARDALERAAPDGALELEQITDFIFSRRS